VSWAQLGVPAGKKVFVRDLWAHIDIGVVPTQYSAVLEPREVAMIRVTPQ